jgi:hypothetical protein
MLMSMVWCGFKGEAGQKQTHQVEALAIPNIPRVWHGALERSAEYDHSCPGQENGLDRSSDPFISY